MALEHLSLMLLMHEYVNAKIPRQDNAVWYWYPAGAPQAKLILPVEAYLLLTKGQRSIFHICIYFFFSKYVYYHNIYINVYIDNHFLFSPNFLKNESLLEKKEIANMHSKLIILQNIYLNLI